MSQTMKPITAAAKLGIYLPAAPRDFQDNSISRGELDALREDPPQWLQDLRRNGPFPRDVVAQKLGVSKSGLARGGITEALTHDEIGDLIANPPGWLIDERETHRKVLEEQSRSREQR